MAIRNVTQVEGTDFVKIAQRLGLDIKVNKGFTKCYRPGSVHIGVGIPNTKMVTRVELVGFTHPLGIAHPRPPAKTVEQMMDFSKDRKQILQDFYQICAEGLLGASLDSSSPASPVASSPVTEEAVIEMQCAAMWASR